MKTAIQQTSGLSRIIQGHTAPGHIPWQAQLRLGSPSNYRGICGGTIIDAKTILTAAHCCHDQDTNTQWPKSISTVSTFSLVVF